MSYLTFALAWYTCGIICALYWPLYYKDGLDDLGHREWQRVLRTVWYHALAGPFAIVTNFPV